MSALPNDEATQEEAVDEVEAALAWHNGDARQTIATLLDDIRHMRLQLALTEVASSRGFARGWHPSFERP